MSEEVEREFLRLVPAWLAGKIQCHPLVGSDQDPIHASRKLRLSVTEQISGDTVVLDADILCVRKINVTTEDVPPLVVCPNRDNDGHWNNDPEISFSTSKIHTYPCLSL